jgi:hypothetical protein
MFLTPRRVFAGEVSPVIVIREAAATAKITITNLRGNVSVLEGSGGISLLWSLPPKNCLPKHKTSGKFPVATTKEGR